MKKFTFRLEKVLNHKSRLYELAQNKYSQALQELRSEEAKLDELRVEYSRCLFELSQKTTHTFRVRELGPYYRYLTFVKREIAHQSRVVCQAIEKEEACRKALMEAAKEKETLVKLKEKQYEEYVYVFNREEQKFLDDITAAKFLRTVRSKT